MKVEHEPCVEEKEGEQPEKRKRIVLHSLGEYINKQLEESKEDYNKWFAGEEVGHDPTPEEMFTHYAKYGGAKNFAKKCTHLDACTPEEKEELEREQSEKENDKNQKE
ncbi:MAG: hypothetical protein ABIC82_01935 [bacterium]